MASEKRQKRFHVEVKGGNLQEEVFKSGDFLRVKPGMELVSGCLAYMRIGRVGNQHTWRRYIGRYFEEKRGRRTFRLPDQERTILDLRKEELSARVRGERVDIFRVSDIVHLIPHATILAHPWFEWGDGKMRWFPPSAGRRKGKAA